MSEPVSNDEIESVLSSIRELVSNDEKAAKNSQEGEPGSTLVLTQALRVGKQGTDQPNDKTEPLEFRHSKAEADTPAKTDDKVPKNSAAQTSKLESTIAELEAVVGKQEGEWEPDGSNPEEDVSAKTDMSESTLERADNSDETEAAVAVAKVKSGAVTKTGIKAKSAVPAKDENPGINEDTLKAMVADLMRKELDGALGTKITRDVRKVVRAEVRLALKNNNKK